MGPRALLTVGVLLSLGGAAAWVEYGQHSAIIRRTVSADVEQLCASLREEHRCPAQLSFPKRKAIDPWGRRYRCTASFKGKIFYSLGADNKLGGTNRDADVACATFAAEPAHVVEDACSCAFGEEATHWLR
jgi:hypothetical protein